jgi:hypothetical protein
VKRAAVFFVVALASCRTQSPTPAPTSAAGLAAELVGAGCVADSSTLVGSIQAEEASDAAPAWLQCLARGGSILACGAPCSGDM